MEEQLYGMSGRCDGVWKDGDVRKHIMMTMVMGIWIAFLADASILESTKI